MIGLKGYRAIELLGYWAIGLYGAIGLYRAICLKGYMAMGLIWLYGLLGYRAIWAMGQ